MVLMYNHASYILIVRAIKLVEQYRQMVLDGEGDPVS
jgi:hypothetical protein